MCTRRWVSNKEKTHGRAFLDEILLAPMLVNRLFISLETSCGSGVQGERRRFITEKPLTFHNMFFFLLLATVSSTFPHADDLNM